LAMLSQLLQQSVNM